VKKFLARFKVLAAIVASFAIVLGSATVVNLAAEPAQAATTPFTCTSDFYQVSAGKMYEYSVPTNTYSVMSGATTLTGLNDIGYNTADNYIYGIVTNKVYKIDSTGKPDAGTTLSATPSNAGGDFVGANLLLTVNTTGQFTGVNVTTDAVTNWGTATGWRAYDIAFDPASSIGYGMNGTTLYVGAVNVAGKAVTVTTKTVTGSGAGTADNWGAAYVDSAGDAYFFDNTTFDLVEISAASLALAAPAATNITQANSLAAPNDGASCPTASSPLAPTVVTTAATSVALTSATLNGTVATGIPASSNILTGGIQICYSTSNTLVGGALSVSPVCAATTPSSLPVNTAATAVTLPVTGLSSGTTYYFQVEATNAFGLEAFGNVQSLTTVAANQTVTFNNNGGSGTMANEVNNAAAALSANTFTRVGFTFSGWNTVAAGTGTAYADGASYPFDVTRTLYAQWTAIANTTVTFDNNTGTGSMTPESDNVPTALTANSFTKAGYTFTGWNTVAGGTGTAYADGASYPFDVTRTLYAQWSIANHTVTFDNNTGTGTMANQVNNLPTNLTANTFTKAGYTFTGWNTVAGGTGTAYADGASYPFDVTRTLYAQ
jgi:Listeria-Bacteroides repeat domain (List_Bact_rpt)